MSLTASEIQERLQTTLAGGEGSPVHSEVDVREGTLLRCAAVLIPLVLQDGDWHVLFTRRTQQVESHKGQVSFPGGACDEGETTPQQTALRELQEEIGIRPESVSVIGRLATLITISNFRVTPVVGVLKWPAVFCLNDQEVERVFTVPLAWLAQAGNRWELPIPGARLSLVVYHPYDGELVWGATARMTLDFITAIGI